MTLLDETRAAEAIEHAEHVGLLIHPELLPDTDVLAAIALVAQQAELLPGGLAALLAGDYADDPAAFCLRMRRALGLAAHIHHAEDQYPALTGKAAAHENGELR